MEKRYVLLVLAVFALLTTGMVWATADQPATAPSAEKPAEEVEIETAEEMLDAIIVKADNKDACCVADCYDQMAACRAECGNNQACQAGCGAELRECRRGC